MTTLIDLVADAATSRNDPIRAIQILRQLEPWLEPEELRLAAERCAAYYLKLLRFETAERVRRQNKGRPKGHAPLRFKLLSR